MNSLLRYSVILVFICALSAVGVGVTYILTREAIHEQQEMAKESALPIVLPEAKAFAKAAVHCPEHNAWITITSQARSEEKITCPVGGEELNLDEIPEGFDIIYAGYAAAEPSDEQLMGYASIGEAQGYSSRIRVMVGMTGDLSRIVGIKVLFHQETPGLGAKVDEQADKQTLWQRLFGEKKAGDVTEIKPWFQEQFRNLPPVDLGLKSKGRGDIDAITGATITSEAVVVAVKEAFQKVSAWLRSREVP